MPVVSKADKARSHSGASIMVRRLKIAVGFLLLVLGGVMIVTPGPGWLAVGGGLGLLASEYDWARRWLTRVRNSGAVLAFRRHRMRR
jgi:uncharacterized protein (TIGR02611 family)